MPRLLPPCSHLTRKRGVFYYRRILPGRPRREVAISLGTSRYREAEWLAERLNPGFKSALDRAMAMSTTAPPNLAGILREALREALRVHLSTATPATGPVPYALYRPEWLADLKVDALRALQDRDCKHLKSDVDDLMQRHGLPEDARTAVCVGLLEMHLRVLEEARKRASGEVPLMLVDEEVPAPPPAAKPVALPPALSAAKPSVSALLDGHFAWRRSVDATEQVIGQEKGTMRRFIEAAGDRPVDAYGRGDITTFLDTLRRLPNTYGRSPKDKARTLTDITAEADAKGAERLTEKTVKRHLSALAQFFRFAMDQGHLLNAQRAELVEDYRFREERAARHQRDGWTSEELTKLFASPVWTGCRPFFRSQAGPEIIRDDKFWLPILALYHGARLEEFADLYRRDVIRDDGTWAIRLEETEDNPETGDRRLKTRNAQRIIPLHPELLRLGFLEYAAGVAPSPDDPLFPLLKPQGPDRKRGPRFTRWFGHYRREVGVYREGVAMHAFRHTAITRLSDVIKDEQQRRHRDFVMGHGSGGSEGTTRYDKGPGLKAAADTLALLDFPEVNLTHLYTAVA